MSKNQIWEEASNLLKQGKRLEAVPLLKRLASNNLDNREIVFFSLVNLAVVDKDATPRERISLLIRALRINQSSHYAWNSLGNLLVNHTHHAALACWCYYRALEIDNSYIEALHGLAYAQLRNGDLRAAEKAAKRAIQINPGDVRGYTNLICAQANKATEKETFLAYKQIYSMDGSSSNAIRLARSALDAGKYEVAYSVTQEWIGREESSQDFFIICARTLVALKRVEEAKELLLRFRHKISAEFLCISASINKIEGEFADAEKNYRRCLEIDYAHSDALLGLAQMGKISESDRHCQTLLERYEEVSASRYGASLGFALAKIFEDSDDYLEASRYLSLANEQKLKYRPSNSEKVLAGNQNALALCFESSASSMVRPKESYANCCFIVGMPRSGSTLLETILSMNGKTKDLGETNAMPKAIKQIVRDIEESRNIVTLEMLKQGRRAYLNSIGYENEHFYTDKMLYNYRNVGIITRMLPEAKIIHIHRHPLDNILSIYKANFARGNGYSSSLPDCADVFHSHWLTIDKWHEQFPGAIYSLSYEDLVTDPEQKVPELIQYLDLEWTDSYLHPEESRRLIQTASIIQARKSISSKSVGRWKRFKELLKPAAERLLEIDSKRYQSVLL